MNQISDSAARLTAITALLGVLIVVLSQLVTAYSLENDLGEVIDTVNLLDKHGVITGLFALVAGAAVIYAIASGSRLATIVVIGMGAAVILVFLVVDLPDVGDTGLFNAPGLGNIDVTGKASAGLWLELTGGLVIVLAGYALSTLDQAQLQGIGPDRKGQDSSRKGQDSDRPQAGPPASKS